VKAVLLYPMNALATDQTARIRDYLAQPKLGQATAGLYIGDRPDTDFRRVMTRREQMRVSPPDALITNHKMLDLLLQRGEDRALWEGAEITYMVLDEFHTYDGAQGTDVAMLLSRLASPTGQSRSYRRWRSATSASWLCASGARCSTKPDGTRSSCTTSGRRSSSVRPWAPEPTTSAPAGPDVAGTSTGPSVPTSGNRPNGSRNVWTGWAARRGHRSPSAR
jgi:hypothetical protein